MSKHKKNGPARKSPLARFTAAIEIDPVTGCYNWTKAINRDGYGKFWDGDKAVLAHRWLLQQFVGTLPVAIEGDHLCRNRRCCNLLHLEPVVSEENKLRIRQPERRLATIIVHHLPTIARA